MKTNAAIYKGELSMSNANYFAETVIIPAVSTLPRPIKVFYLFWFAPVLFLFGTTFGI